MPNAKLLNAEKGERFPPHFIPHSALRIQHCLKWGVRMSPMSSDSPTTNPSIFVRLKATDAKPREFAWNEFHARYAPIIATFARRLGGKPQDVDDAVQDVLAGFFAKAPTFIYDPVKGRFRGYLKVCTYHALKKRLGKQARVQGKPLDSVPEDSVAV